MAKKYEKGNNFKSFAELMNYLGTNSTHSYRKGFDEAVEHVSFDIRFLRESYFEYAPAIEVKERETIELFEYVFKAVGSSRFMCDNFISPDRVTQFNKDSYLKLPNGRSFKIYADTFEVVE